LFKSSHEPPFRQGLLLHGCTFIAQFGPAKPGKQLHVKKFGNELHLPPLRHGTDWHLIK